MLRDRLRWLVPATVFLVGCATASLPDQETTSQDRVVAAQPSDPGHKEIAKLVSRDRSITLIAGHGDVRVTVVDASGKLIAREVPIGDLESIDATSYQLIDGTVAGARLLGASAPY
jgi:hypothetical protein